MNLCFLPNNYYGTETLFEKDFMNHKFNVNTMHFYKFYMCGISNIHLKLNLVIIVAIFVLSRLNKLRFHILHLKWHQEQFSSWNKHFFCMGNTTHFFHNRLKNMSIFIYKFSEFHFIFPWINRRIEEYWPKPIKSA